MLKLFLSQYSARLLFGFVRNFGQGARITFRSGERWQTINVSMYLFRLIQQILHIVLVMSNSRYFPCSDSLFFWSKYWPCQQERGQAISWPFHRLHDVPLDIILILHSCRNNVLLFDHRRQGFSFQRPHTVTDCIAHSICSFRVAVEQQLRLLLLATHLRLWFSLLSTSLFCHKGSQYSCQLLPVIPASQGDSRGGYY